MNGGGKCENGRDRCCVYVGGGGAEPNRIKKGGIVCRTSGEGKGRGLGGPTNVGVATSANYITFAESVSGRGGKRDHCERFIKRSQKEKERAICEKHLDLEVLTKCRCSGDIMVRKYIPLKRHVEDCQLPLQMVQFKRHLT